MMTVPRFSAFLGWYQYHSLVKGA